MSAARPVGGMNFAIEHPQQRGLLPTMMGGCAIRRTITHARVRSVLKKSTSPGSHQSAFCAPSIRARCSESLAVLPNKLEPGFLLSAAPRSRHPGRRIHGTRDLHSDIDESSGSDAAASRVLVCGRVFRSSSRNMLQALRTLRRSV